MSSMDYSPEQLTQGSQLSAQSADGAGQTSATLRGIAVSAAAFGRVGAAGGFASGLTAARDSQAQGANAAQSSREEMSQGASQASATGIEVSAQTSSIAAASAPTYDI